MRTGNRARSHLVTAPTLAWALLAIGCGGDGPPPPTPPAVTVAQPTRGDVQTYAEFTGTTRATAFAEIRARVSGRLEEMYFEPSTFVDRGDVLFLIEPQAYQAAYDEAVATVASAESELSRAQSDLERIEQAIQSDAVSRQDLDRATATRDQAQAALLAARARRDQAALSLEYTRVETPVSGQVSRNLVDLGNLVGAGEPTLLTTVTQIQPIWVYFNAAENLVLAYRAAQGDSAQIGPGEDQRVGVVQVATANETGYPHVGQIDFIDNTVDPATGTIEMRAVLPNDDLVLFSGLFVRLRVLGPIQENAVLIEEQALGTDLGGKYVMVVGDDNVVEQRYVTLGPAQDDGTIVVAEGLDGTERYVVNGQLRARPGFPVTPQTAAEAQAEAGRGPTIGPPDGESGGTDAESEPSEGN